ncbi:MAG: NADH-quinone oxidoreductase subunit NuoH [Desulfuromonas sp.]|nr:MAG: NADH-quinone oxidoreductase subunit NuoH [Desulfuromonas sp.]
MNELLITLALILFKMVLVFGVVLSMAAYLVLAERKILGRMQLRYGPNRIGPGGMIQPMCDVIKLITKEDFIPDRADKWVFLFAPGLTALTALLSFAVVPFSAPITLFGREVPMVICDLNIGLLYLLGLSSAGAYGVVLGGWASNSKYSLLGAMRSVGQLLSYELAMGLALIPVILSAKSFSLTEIVMSQQNLPNLIRHPLAFFIFMVAVAAESKRTPFDMPEAENEIVGGFHTEYSGMRFGLFFVGEYINLIVIGAMVTVLFLGGWHGPLLPPVAWFMLKVLLVAFCFIWARGSMPRPRYDQLMHFGWKVLIPLGLINVLVTGAILLALGG